MGASKKKFMEEMEKDIERDEIAIDYHESGQYDYDKSIEDLQEQEFSELNNQIEG